MPVFYFWQIVFCSTEFGQLLMGNLEVGWKHRDKINTYLTIQYILKLCLALARTQNCPTALCLSCGTNKQERGCLSFLGSVNILNTNKFLWSERGETHTVRAAALSLHRGLWCPSERADNEGPLHLNSFNWSVDVTGCWYLVVIVLAWRELRTNLKEIRILIFKLRGEICLNKEWCLSSWLTLKKIKACVKKTELSDFVVVSSD